MRQKDTSRIPEGVNLLLLPYAGAGASIYRGWETQMPAGIRSVPLTPPGRGARYGEPPLLQWDPLIDRLMADIVPILDRPYAIFGQSMGALIGLELAHEIQRHSGSAPIWLGFSSCIAPSRRVPELKWRTAPADDLRAELNRLGGTPPPLLQNPELLELLLPAIRADFHLCGSYTRRVRPPLECPLLVLGGVDDDISANAANFEAWASETRGPFRLEMLPGGHFLSDTMRQSVINLVISDLLAAMAARYACDG